MYFWVYMPFKQNYFDKLTKLIGEYAEAILRQRDKVKITDQSEELFKQKAMVRNKNKRPRCIKVGNGPFKKG